MSMKFNAGTILRVEFNEDSESVGIAYLDQQTQETHLVSLPHAAFWDTKILDKAEGTPIKVYVNETGTQLSISIDGHNAACSDLTRKLAPIKRPLMQYAAYNQGF